MLDVKFKRFKQLLFTDTRSTTLPNGGEKEDREKRIDEDMNTGRLR